MIKVLVVGMTHNPGGVESVIMNYYRNIDKSKIQFDFIQNTDTLAYSNEINSLGAQVFKITPRRKNPFKFHKELKSVFVNNKYDAIWVNLCSLANITYLKYAKKYGVKKRIIHSHNSQNMDSKLRYVLHCINKRKIDKYATDFWSCSNEASKWFYKDSIIKSDKHKIVYNAVDINKFYYDEEKRKKYKKLLNVEKNFVVGHIGRFHFQKNHTFMLKIFNEIVKKDKSAILLLIGQGEDEEKIKKQCKDLNIEDKVRFLGIRDDINEVLQAFDIFLFPSLFEGLPVVMVEAQASGLPIYASDVISSATKVNDNVKFIPLGDENYWSDIIIKDKETVFDRAKYSENVLKSNFNIIKQTKNFEKFLLNKGE